MNKLMRKLLHEFIEEGRSLESCAADIMSHDFLSWEEKATCIFDLIQCDNGVDIGIEEKYHA